jgi:HlyD family secretion protein
MSCCSTPEEGEAMRRRLVIIGVVVVAVLAVGYWRWTRSRGVLHYTGFVEGEERIIRSEVVGRVQEVAFAEGSAVGADATVAKLDDADIQTRLAAKRQELVVGDADILRQEEQISLTENTWKRDVAARQAELHQAESAAELAEKTNDRERALVHTGASTAQQLDDTHSRRDQSVSALQRAREMYARAAAEEGTIAVARQQLEVLRQRRELVARELAQLEVTAAKYDIRAPAVPTVVQTQYVWPGELAQPGTPIVSLLDPRDKYVQVYVPVADVDLFRVGRPVEIELDSQPGRRFAGAVSFVADRANFTPEKIETRNDRMGQVYRAKVRILEEVEQFQPGTEGNVYLLGEPAGQSGSERRAARATASDGRESAASHGVAGGAATDARADPGGRTR